MWIISKTGFVSLVQDRDNPDNIRARARRREHLTDTFPALVDADGKETEVFDYGPRANDYRWHVVVSRAVAAAAIANAVMGLDYESHVKEEVSGDDEVMHNAMLACWASLYRLQDADDLPRVRWYDELGEPHDDVLHTKTGKVITEEDIAEWADEAEQGYELPEVTIRRQRDEEAERRARRGQWPDGSSVSGPCQNGNHQDCAVPGCACDANDYHAHRHDHSRRWLVEYGDDDERNAAT